MANDLSVCTRGLQGTLAGRERDGNVLRVDTLAKRLHNLLSLGECVDLGRIGPERDRASAAAASNRTSGETMRSFF